MDDSGQPEIERGITMIRICDNHKMYDVRMWYWDLWDNAPRPDFERDFFDVGGLEFDESRGAYRVPDTEYCIEQMTDWLTYSGDYQGNECERHERVFGLERHIAVFEVVNL